MRPDYKKRDPDGWTKSDANVKKFMGPDWSACENCGGIKGSVCTNACYLTEAQSKRFAKAISEAKPDAE